jgi:large subunit ribosomal protein L30
MSSEHTVRSLFVTLRRGLAGKPWFHKRIIDALGLSRPHDCVEKPNNASIRGMLSKVPHMIIVETDRMHYYRRMKEYYSDLTKPPLTVVHGEAASAEQAKPRITEHVNSLIQKHVEASGMEGFASNFQPRLKATRHEQEMRTRERVLALSREGLFSERIKEINKRGIESRNRRLEEGKSE